MLVDNTVEVRVELVLGVLVVLLRLGVRVLRVNAGF
jgi:hypothetical protein